MPIRRTIRAASPDTGSAIPAEPVEVSRPLPLVRQRTRAQAPIPPEEVAAPSPSDGDPPAYEVGYRKPPHHSRFRPGQSGNPRGRPRAAKGLKTIVRETMTARVPVRTATGEKKMSRMEAVLHKTVELGMKGNPRALAQLIALYGAAVPEAATASVVFPVEDLSTTDIAILEELKASWAAEAGDGK